jgi:serine/threonine-protein kinase
MVDDRDEHTALATIDGHPTASDGHAGSVDREVKKTPGDRYRVVNRLGKGGMGEVMQVRDEIVGREVALKRIRKIEPSDRVVQRFLREASIQGRLEHPAIVPLYDIGRDPAGLPFFTMKKLTGTTLSKILATDRAEFTLQRLLRAFSEVCLAVEFAHVRGIIHRDLKPDNIVLGDFGEVYVLDWGVAKVVGESDAEFADVSSGSSEDNEHATIPGTAVGTPGFMPPEQVRGDVDVDARADVYALGCLLFQILTRSMLHPAGKAGLASAEAGIDARPSRRAPTLTIAPELDELCVHATHVDRNKRVQTARELGDRVQSFLDGDRDVAMRHKLATDHLAKAQTAFAAGDDQRAIAMREASSAIALDPELTAAAELLGRLMLEPPRTMPREVEDSILEDDVATMQGNARVGIFAYLGFFAFLPLAWWVAPAGSPWLLVLSLLIFLNIGVCWWGSRVNPLGREGVIAVTNAILLAVVARMYTPFLPPCPASRAPSTT